MTLLVRFGLSLLAALALIGLFPGTASAGTATVVDNAGVLDAGDIQAAAAGVEGVDFIVVTLRTGNRDIERELKALGPQVGWADGGWQSNTVVLAVNLQSRQLGAFAGEGTTASIGTSRYTAVQDALERGFATSWTAGMVAGIDETRSIVTPSYTWVWVLAAGVVLVIGWLLFRSAKTRKAKQQKKAADEQQAAVNQLTAVNLRQRIDELEVLVETVPDGPHRDPLENDLSDVDVALRRREERGGLSGTDLGVPVEQDTQNLDGLRAVLDKVAARLAMLRQDTGWQDAWNDAVAGTRHRINTVTSNQAQLIDEESFEPMDTSPLDAQLATMASAVRDGRTSVADGIAILDSVDSAVASKQIEVDAWLAQKEQAEQAERERLDREAQERNNRNNRGGGGSGFGGGFAGAVLGGVLSSGRRRRGGGFGGGGFGGGGFGGGGGRGFGGGGGGRGFGGGGGGGRGF